jgi:hypothetical protein
MMAMIMMLITLFVVDNDGNIIIIALCSILAKIYFSCRHNNLAKILRERPTSADYESNDISTLVCPWKVPVACICIDHTGD